MQYAKSYAALIGAVCTALLGVFAADTQVGKVLTVLSVIATAVATYAVPNARSLSSRRPTFLKGGEGGESALYVLAVVALFLVVLLLVLRVL